MSHLANQIEFVPEGLVIAPWDTGLLLPLEQCEKILEGRPWRVPDAIPASTMVSSAYRPLFDDSLIGVIRHFCYFGGRGGAKSWVAVLAAVKRMRRFKGYRVANIRQHQVSLDQSVHQLYKKTIERLGVMDEFHITDNPITHRTTGAEAIFKGVGINTDNIRSLEDVDLCIVEEATQLSKAGIATLIPTIRSPKAQFIWLWNPSDEGPQAIDIRFRDKPPQPDTIVTKVNFNTANPHWFYASLVGEEKSARADKDEHEHTWLGEYPTSTVASVFKQSDWSIGYCRVPLHVDPLYGMDFGFSPDPTVLLRVWVIEPDEPNEKGVIYISDCVTAGELTTADMPAFIDQIPNPTEEAIRCDNSEPRSIEDLNAAGYPAVAAPKGPGSIKAGIKFLKSYHIRVAPECDPIVALELRKYSHKIDKTTGYKLPDLVDDNNHSIDSLRYAVWDHIRAQKYDGVEHL